MGGLVAIVAILCITALCIKFPALIPVLIMIIVVIML